MEELNRMKKWMKNLKDQVLFIFSFRFWFDLKTKKRTLEDQLSIIIVNLIVRM